MRAMWFLAVLVVSSPATADPVPFPRCKDADPKRPPPRSVKDVDWCNFDFGVLMGKGGALRRGHSRLHLYARLDQAHDSIAVSLRGVVYGDLEGDGVTEAAIVLQKSMVTGGGTRRSSWTWVTVYGFAGGKPRELASVDVKPPVHDISLGNNFLLVAAGVPEVARRYRRDAKTKTFVEHKP